MLHFLHLKDSLRYTSYTNAHYQTVAACKNIFTIKKADRLLCIKKA